MNKNKIEFILFKFFVKVVHFLGRRKSLRLAEILGNFFFTFIPIRKKVVLKNLSAAFPEKSSKEIEQIARLNYIHFLKTFFDTFLIPKLSREEIMKYVEVNGLEKLKEAYSQGKGVVLLTGHFGNWELGAVTVGLGIGEPINVLTKQQRNPYVTEWMDNVRQHFGNKVSNLGTGVRKLYKTLKDGGIIGIVGDQRGPKESMRVKIFDRQTAFYTGFASIIAKSKAPVIIVLMPRHNDDTYRLEILNMDYMPEDPNAVFNITQEYASILESYIRKYPEQWFWMHNIWKY